MASRPESEIFDRNPDPALDELTELAAVLCHADYAYIGSMNLNRLWFKSRFGFEAAEQPRSSTACQWVLEKGQPLLIRDAARDARFPSTGIPLIGAEACRSYAGVPLLTGSRQVVGTLAVLAREAGQFNQEHISLLEVLGRQVVTRLELYARVAAPERALRALQQAGRALSNSRLFVTAALESIPFLAALLNRDGRIVQLNYPCMQLTGLTLADAVGYQFVDLVLEADYRVWAAARLRDAAAGQVSGPHETDWRTRGGETRRVTWTVRPLPGPDGVIQFLIVSGQDITDQRQAEMNLRVSETRYQQLVENSPGLLFTCSLEGLLTSLNAHTAETLGHPVKELSGRSVASFLDRESEASFQDCLRTLETKDEWQGALSLRRSDGVYRRIAFRSRRMQLPGEKPFVLNHGIDVTEQHEAEQALHMATRQRQLILESVDDGIYGIDLEGRLTFINQAGARAMGCTPGQLTGQDLLEVIHHSRADGTPHSRSTSPILQALRRCESIRMRDEVFWRQDGSAFPVEYSANPILEDGRISGMVVAFQDVSERRRLEKMKDEFISTVSHELRTPLTSLRASLGLISSGTLDKRPGKQRQMVEIAIGNCDRLIRLVNDILDFDRVEKGKLALDRQPVEAIGLLRRAADVARTAASQMHIALRVDAPSVQVLVDGERILQVLNELLANAIKFSPPQTTIRLAAQPCNEGSSASGQVCFLVEDQGCGIAPEKLERIFERFQQGDASDSRALGGTGLGLALCRSIVEQHGGRIWAESTPGKGSRFLFTVPAAASSAQ